MASLSRNTFGVLERTVASGARDRPAFLHGGDTRTFGQLHERSLRVASGLAGLGIGRGDRVAVLLTNRHEWPEVFFGLAGLGAICVPVNVLLRAHEVAHVCEDSDTRCLIVDSAATEVLHALDALPPLVVRVGLADVPAGPRVVDYEALLAAASARPVEGGPDLADVQTLYYTSGTTGLPKAAVHTHENVLWNSFHQIPDLGLSPRDVYLVVPSLSWAAGFHDLVLALAWIGGSSVLMPTGGTTIDRIVATVEATGATHALLVPTLLKQLLAVPDALERLRGSTLRAIISGAEPVPRPVIEQVNEELPNARVMQGYGLSEFPTIATLLRPEEAIAHAGSAGRPLSVTDLALSSGGEIVREGEGEILLRSPATMREYWRRPEETAEVFAGGWLHTGDVGRVDADGFLTITGRSKDMIISGGLNVYPKEIEEVLYTLGGVAEAAVVGVPDERWGEAAVAIVVSNGKRLDPEEVVAWCRERLAGFKCPREVLLRDEPLPRTPSGKVLKRDLRPWAEARLADVVNDRSGGTTR